jgi:PAS domain S-box-containing protein
MKTFKIFHAPQSVRRLLLIITSTIFLGELFDMWLLNNLSQLSPFPGAMLDSFVLIVLLSPVFIFLIFRPLTALIGERSRAENELRNRTNELSALLKCSQSLSASLDVGTVLQSTTDNITALMDLPSSAIYLLKNDLLYLGATSPSLPPNFPDELRCAQLSDHPHIQQAITSAQPVFLYDTHEADLTPAEHEASIQRGLRSVLYIPLIANEHVIGTLIVAKMGEPRSLAESEINLCRTLAGLAAMAIENALLYEQARREIAERTQAEQNLAYEKERLTVTLRSIGDGVITTGTDGRIVMLNKAAEAMTGWTLDTAIGLPLPEVFPIINELTRVPCENPIEKVLRTGAVIELANHTCLIAKDGREIIIADSGAPIRDNASRIIGVVLVFRDMTEKQKLTDSMQRAQKLESLGILAGGIAHDFNNMLAGIFGYVELAKVHTLTNTYSDVPKILDKALGVFDRAKGLTQQLLTFSKGGVPIRKTTMIGPLIEHSAGFALSGSNVNCNFHLPDTLWLCDCDENQLGQAIDNIVINAKQAMPSGGTITIAADNVEDPAGHAGSFIRISITDEGIGIPKEILSKIYDPFFSTKASGHGLGLATVFSIIQRHDGWIDVESTPGAGTAFHLFLPASQHKLAGSERIARGEYTGSGTILVMDDEEFIREIVGSLLQQLGFSVALAAEGQEALSLFANAERSGTPFTASILDMTIPGGAGGKDIAGAMKAINPAAIIVASSGYSEDPVISNPTAYGFTDSIIKPYRKDELVELMMRLLDH